MKKLPSPQPVKPSLLPSLNQDWILGFLLLITLLIAYQPALNGTMLWDDNAHITKPELRSFDGLARIWTKLGATQQYYPLVHTVFWVEYRLWGASPLGYHLLNILLHFLSALLLVRILRYLKVPGAWLAGAIFALHPVQVESVAWMTELKNTLSGVFYLSAALMYLKFDQERKKKIWMTALLLFVLGLMSKSVIATLPVSLLALFWWKRGRIDWKRDVLPLLLFFAVGIASGLFTAWVEHTFIIGREKSAFTFTLIERCLIAGRAVWFYLGKLFWPADLIFIYPRWNVSQAIWWQYLFPIAALMLAGMLWMIRRRWRSPLAVFVCFTAALFPVLGFFNVYPFQFSFVADHFQYLACIGPIALTSAGIVSASGLLKNNIRCYAQPPAGMIILLTLGILTWKQSRMYTDPETLFRTVIKKNDASCMVHNNLGFILDNGGRKDEALYHYQKAVEIKPDYAEAHYNLGGLYAHFGRASEAIAQYRKTLEIKPDYFEAYNYLGYSLLKTGQTDKAAAAYQKALELNPNYNEAHCNLGTLLLQSGQTDEAISHYHKALENKPDCFEAHYNLGLLSARAGRIDEAITHYQKALEIDPGHIDGHDNLGILLYQSNRIDEAIAHFQKALEINPDNISTLQNMAAVLAQNGQLTYAMEFLQKALALAKSTGDVKQIKEISINIEKINKVGR